MTCHDVIMASQTCHFEFEAPILDPDPAVIQLTMTTTKIYEFVLGNILNQKEHKKAKDYLFLTN